MSKRVKLWQQDNYCKLTVSVPYDTDPLHQYKHTPSALRAVVQWTQRLSRTGDQQWCTVRRELLSSNLVHCAAVSPNQSWQLQSLIFQGRKIKAWHWRCRAEIEEGVKNKSCFVEKFSRKKERNYRHRVSAVVHIQIKIAFMLLHHQTAFKTSHKAHYSICFHPLCSLIRYIGKISLIFVLFSQFN